MIVVPYRAEHLYALQVQQAQAYASLHITPEHAKSLEPTQAFTAMAGDKVIGCGGLLELWSQRALVWAYVSRDAGAHFLAVHRTVSAFIESAPYRRIEADVACEFDAAHRWMRMLGFQLEAERMRCHRPDGGDSALYAKVKNGPR